MKKHTPKMRKLLSNSRTVGFSVCLSLSASIALVNDEIAAQESYISMSLGLNTTQAMTLKSNSNDRASICDEFINPRATTVDGCTNTDRGSGDGWLAAFDSGKGIVAEAEFGRRLTEKYRLGAAYSYLTSAIDQTVSSSDASGADFDKINNELAVGEESLGDIAIHQIRIVGYRDWPNSSSWTPFIGMSVGFARTKVGYSYVWARSPDPEDILTGVGQPNADEIRNNLAGTVSAGRIAVEDSSAGYGLLAGIDRQMSDAVTLGFKVEWSDFSTFETKPFTGTVLRSHENNLRLDGSEPVTFWSRIEETARLSSAITLRYSLR